MNFDEDKPFSGPTLLIVGFCMGGIIALGLGVISFYIFSWWVSLS